MVFATLTLNGSSDWEFDPSEHAPAAGSGALVLRR